MAPVQSEVRGKSLTIPILILSVLYISSVIFFHFIEGWNFLDAAYFTTTTISTVGLGDIYPTTPLGKLGTIFLIFAGVSLAFYVITHLGAIREKTVDTHLRKRLDILHNITALRRSKLDEKQINTLKKKIKGSKKS